VEVTGAEVADEQKEGTPPTPKGKKGNFVGKYKWYIVGGIAVIGILFVSMKGKGGGGQDSSQSAGDYASQNAINPSTGYLYGSPADLAAQGSGSMQTSIPGPQGPPGPAGPAGPAGSNPPPHSTLPSRIKTPPHLAKIADARRVVTPVSQHYTVKPGDSLSKIAAIHGITGGWQSIYSKNKTVIGKNPNLIHPGQRLVL
jgi:LysM repeat protein